MRIGIFTCEYMPYPGGIATYCYELAKAAVRLGHEPIVYTFAQGGAAQPEPEDFRVVRLPPDRYKHWRLPEMARAMRRHEKQDRLDLVYAADMQSIIAFSMVPRSGPRRAGLHGTEVLMRPMKWLADYTPLKPLKSYDAVIANSEFTKALTLKHHPYVPPERLRTALLGVDDYWRASVSEAEIDEVWRRYGLAPDQTVFLSIGRLEERKGMLNSVKALSDVPEAVGKVTYLVIGRVVDEAYARDVADAAAASKVDIRLLGAIPRDDIRALTRRAVALVHAAKRKPTKVEGFGLVIMEAAAGGLPSIVTRVDALPEVVKEGRTGFIVEDGDLGGLSAALARVVRDRGDIAAMRDDCVAWSQNFNWQSCARTAFGV